MDTRKFQFLTAVIGVDGARALAKATSASADLEWAIFPRVVMSWLEVQGHAPSFNEGLPGVDEVRLNFRKSEDAFTGSINIGPDVYAFRDATLYHVAGSVAVALGASPDHAPELRSPALAKLGKSVDLLVRSRTLRKMQAAHAGGARGAKPPGVAAAPIPPSAAQPPVPVQGNVPSQVGTKVGTTAKASATPKLPSVKPTPAKTGVPKKSTLKVTKAEAALHCRACGDTQFKASTYIGCICFSDLRKAVATHVVADGYVLEFGSSWDAAAITTLAETLGK
jgi:hypothetical protein